jgi:transposase
MYRRRTKGKTIRQCRREIQHQALVRGLFLGMSTRAIAKQLKLSMQTVRDWAATPEIQGALTEYTRAQFEAMDQRMPYMLKKTQTQLIRALKRGDFEAIKLMCAETGLIGRLMDRELAKL